MTEVHALLQGHECNLALEGHATGSREVCAAISSIVYALAGYLANAEAAGNAQVQETLLEPGHVRIRCTGDDAAMGACGMAIHGLRQLAAQYPEQVKIFFKKSSSSGRA